MNVNLNKTKAVVFRNGRHKVNNPLLIWGDEKIEVVNQYTYLTFNSRETLFNSLVKSVHMYCSGFRK
jgi:uncharacterized protein YmfQ (DUF2313 family)